MGKPTRASLASFRPEPFPAAATQPAAPISRPATVEVTGRKKYPHVSVYLPAATVRTLKLIALDHECRVSDLCAEAINEWLERNGHARSET